jgi:hypothetical protein
MSSTIVQELHLPINENKSLDGHFNLDRDTNCFVVSYHIEDMQRPGDMYVPVRYFLKKIGDNWQNGYYENGKDFQVISDPYADQIKDHLLRTYYNG